MWKCASAMHKAIWKWLNTSINQIVSLYWYTLNTELQLRLFPLILILLPFFFIFVALGMDLLQFPLMFILLELRDSLPPEIIFLFLQFSFPNKMYNEQGDTWRKTNCTLHCFRYHGKQNEWHPYWWSRQMMALSNLYTFQRKDNFSTKNEMW